MSKISPWMSPGGCIQGGNGLIAGHAYKSLAFLRMQNVKPSG